MEILSFGYSVLLTHIETITVVLGVASATMAGVFFAFSMFVMTALGNLVPAEGIRAMQRINIDVFCWSFMSLFFGLPLVFAIVGILALSQLETVYAKGLLLAAVMYLAGVFAVTILGNVPLNNALARVDTGSGKTDNQLPTVESPQSAVWDNYLIVWQRWNHVRAFVCLLVSVVLLCLPGLA